MKFKALNIVIWLFLLSLKTYSQSSDFNPEFTHNIIEANRQKVLGNFEAAKSLYEKCLTLNPKSAVTYYELASYYIQFEQYTKAIDYAKKAVKLQPDNYWYKNLLGVLYKQTKQINKAIDVYKELTKLNPNVPDFYYELYYLHLGKSNLNKALKVLNQIENKFGISEFVILEKEKIYSFRNNFTKSEKEIKRLINTNPYEIRYYGILAEIYISQNKLDKAKETYDKMIQIDSTNGLMNLSLSNFYRMTGDIEKSFYHLGIAFRSPDLDIDTKIRMLVTLLQYSRRNVYLFSEAEKLLNILLEMYPQDIKVLSLYSDMLLDQQKDFEAYNTLLKILNLDASKYIIWEKVLMFEYSQKMWDSLLIHSSNSIEYFPLQQNLYFFKAIAEYELKKYNSADETLSYLQTLPITNNDFLLEVYSLHAEVLHKLGKNAESDEKFEKALKIDKNNRIILNNYSYYLSLRSDSLDKAEKMILICLEIEPNNPTFLDTYAWILYKMNKLNEALKYIEKAYQLKKNDAEIIEHYGDILYKLGRYDEALEKWKEAYKTGQGSILLEQKILQKKLIEQ